MIFPLVKVSSSQIRVSFGRADLLWTVLCPLLHPRVMAKVVLDPAGFVTLSIAEQPGTPASACYSTGPSTVCHTLSHCCEHLTQMLC